jgi:hypothetical protein
MQNEPEEEPRDPPVLDYASLRGERRRTAPGLVTVATFADTWEANLALGKLRAEGIEATLADQNIVAAGGGLYTGLAGGIKLQVPAGDEERALAVLPKRSTGERVKCPRCGSFDTRAVPIHPVLKMLYLLMLGLPYVFFGRRWTCAACGNAWRRSIYDEPDDEDEDKPGETDGNRASGSDLV